MKIAVWKTGHEIADKVADAVYNGLGGNDVYCFSTYANLACPADIDLHVGYGILRGMSEVYRATQQDRKPWFCLDRGYWKPGHYDGYYRISLNGTQQTTGLDRLAPDYDRWDALGLGIETRSRHDPDGRILVCPPTEAVSAFFGLPEVRLDPHPKLIIRRKDSNADLQKDLDKCSMVRTFNSSVGWEALRQGIPVRSSPVHSFVGAYQKQFDISPQLDLNSRRRMFAVQASLQLSIVEIKQGLLWPLMSRLIASSGLMTESQSVAM